MIARAIPRSAVHTYLKLLRLPLDGAISLLPGDRTGPKPAARLALDRLDAMVRAGLATVLSDPALNEEAERRQEAAERREHALELRAEAERKDEQADARLQMDQQEATRQREQADQLSRARREEAARREAQEKRRAAKAESERRESSRKATKRAEEALNERAAKERLDTLSIKSDAMRQKEQELAARDEARRLGEAASRTKAERQAG